MGGGSVMLEGLRVMGGGRAGDGKREEKQKGEGKQKRVGFESGREGESREFETYRYENIQTVCRVDVNYNKRDRETRRD